MCNTFICIHNLEIHELAQLFWRLELSMGNGTPNHPGLVLNADLWFH